MYPGENAGTANRQGGSEPRFAVCVAAFNVAEFIRENIESVLAQTSSDWELIVVDDGSTDATGSIAVSYSNRFPNVTVIQQSNQGISAARNRAIHAARAPWIVTLDADDMLAPTMIETMSRVVASNSQYDAFVTSMDLFDSRTGQVLARWHRPYNEAPDAREVTLYEVYRHTPNHGGATIRRSLLLEIGGYSADRNVTEDWDMWVRLYKDGAARVLYVPDAGYLYRKHPHQTTANREKRLTGKIETSQRHEELYEHDIAERELLLLMRQREELLRSISRAERDYRHLINWPLVKGVLSRVPGVMMVWKAVRRMLRGQA